MSVNKGSLLVRIFIDIQDFIVIYSMHIINVMEDNHQIAHFSSETLSLFLARVGHAKRCRRGGRGGRRSTTVDDR